MKEERKTVSAFVSLPLDSHTVSAEALLGPKLNTRAVFLWSSFYMFSEDLCLA